MNTYAACSQTAVEDSLRQLVANHPHDTIGIKALVNLASEVVRRDMEKAKEYAFQGLRMAHALHTTIGVASNYSHLTTYYSNRGMPDSALFYLDQIRLLIEHYPENNDIKLNYYFTAGLFYKNKGEYGKALTYMLKALDYMVADKHKLSRAGQLLNIGNAYVNLGNIQQAADYHLRALKQFETLGNKRGQSFCLHSLGNDFQKLNRLSEAKSYYKQSLALKEELGDIRGMINSWTNLGSVYTELGQFKVAHNYFNKSLKQSRALNLTQNELTALHELGSLYLKWDQLAKARATFKQGLPLARQRGDSSLSARFAAKLAHLQQDSLQHQVLQQALINKLETARQAGERDAEADAYQQLAQWHAAEKQYEQAYDLLKKHYQLKDSVVGGQVLVQLKQLEEQYAQEKSTKEIMLLKKDRQLKEAVIEKQLANQRIITLLFVAFIVIGVLLLKYYQTLSRAKRLLAIERVRNSIARDLHDDMGSALSSIHINSQLAMGDSTRTHSHLQRISDSAARMMESMADIVWSINPENDTLEKMIIRMKEFAAEILEPKNISYSFNVGEELGNTRLTLETRKNLYLIFKESINNAAKYSEGSAVVIAIHLLNNKLHLSVRDNGKGFDSAVVRYGNGLNNMAERAHSLRGQLIRQSTPGQGTEIVAELPIT